MYEDSETDIDDFLLWTLRHGHPKQRVVLGEMIANH